MKRTVEIVLTSIGLVLSLIGLVITTVTVFFANTDIFKSGFMEGFEEEVETGEVYNSGEADLILNILLGFGWLLLIALIIAIILGAISIYFFVGNKKPKAASIIMIVGAVVVGFGTVFFGLVPAILYLVAGIVGLVRKVPPQEPPQVTDA